MKAEEEKNIKVYLKDLRNKKDREEDTLASFTAKRDVLVGLPAKIAGSASVKGDLRTVESIIKDTSKKIADIQEEIEACEELLNKSITH